MNDEHVSRRIQMATYVAIFEPVWLMTHDKCAWKEQDNVQRCLDYVHARLPVEMNGIRGVMKEVCEH